MMFDEDNQAFQRLVGHSPSLESVIRTAQIAAAAEVNVLIEGETGTGKELMARAIQAVSRRSERPFITVNCAAMPAELVESILFGHEQGAFTGATSRKEGYVQNADNGTLFLDEIGELALPVQAKLLRFIDNGECQRVGANEVDIVDVRVIAATNCNLLALVDEGRFRKDLFYRLNVVSLQIPPLRERSHDIPELIRHFLADAASRNGSEPVRFRHDAMEVMKKYPWPGNVRELRNVCEHVAALYPGETVSGSHLPVELHVKPKTRLSTSGFDLPSHGINMEELEIDLIRQALELASGNKSEAARLLGLTRDAFLYRIKKHGL